MCATNDVSISPIRVNRVAKSRVQEVDFATVPFGTVFSDHMFSTEFQDGHWSDSSIEPYGPISVAPSITALHYGISVFEGMKAHKSPEGRSLLFRPRENARRLQRSAARLAMPILPETLFLDGLRELVRIDQAWIPPGDLGAVYTRPILFSVDPSIGVKPAERYRFIIFTFPSYLAQGRQFWDASLIYSPTLILRSQFDFWSRPEDVTRLKAHLIHAPVARTIEILEGTHYVLLERAEKGRSQLLQEVLSFLEH
jgi:pimeloyl-ACP methyl ester carboxylesterase